MLIPESHPWVAMAEERHHGPLCDAGHRQRARRVVSEVVKREVRKLEGVHKAPKGDRKRSRLPVGEDPVHRSRKPLKQFAQRVGHRDGTAVAILGFRIREGQFRRSTQEVIP